MEEASLPRLTLVLGGARSGKSRYAERLAAALAPPWIYVATGQALDAEMRERIAEHRARRDPRWTTVEAPYELPAAIRDHAGSASVMLVDCLTLWLSNMLLAEHDLPQEIGQLTAALRNASGRLVVVSNEVGLGVVPDNALARRFRDAQGSLNAKVAAMADRVVLMAAGLPLTMK